MAIRPGKTIRSVGGQVWTRISTKKPRMSYIKGAPRPKVRQYNMGTDQYYEVEVELSTMNPIQIRDNSFEAARQVAVKYLEKNLLGGYYLGLPRYPHIVIREHAAMGVAGADRISKGMKLAFGRPKGRLARIEEGGAVIRIRANTKDLAIVKEALKRAAIKMPGAFKVVTRNITKDPKNIAKIGKQIVMKTKIVEEVKPKAEEAAAAAEGEAKEGEAKAEGKEAEGKKAEGKAEGKEAKTEGKPEAKKDEKKR